MLMLTATVRSNTLGVVMLSVVVLSVVTTDRSEVQLLLRLFSANFSNPRQKQSLLSFLFLEQN
jgi:hypothetical protein